MQNVIHVFFLFFGCRNGGACIFFLHFDKE